MECTVYELTTKGLKKIDTSALAIGQYVEQAEYGLGVVCEKAPNGYLVVYSDGSSSEGQTVGALSPYMRIEPIHPPEFASAEHVAELLAQKRQHDADKREACRMAAEQKAAEVERLTAEYRKTYAWAKTNDPSKNIKKELTAAFPGVKFSVRRDHHSSVTVYWDFGPNEKEVEAITGKYENGHFDGMDDSHKFDHTAKGQAIDAVLGRVRYLSLSRSTGDIWEDVARQLCAIQGLPYLNESSPTMSGATDYHWSAGCQANLLIASTTFPLDFDGKFRVVQNDGNKPHWARIEFAPEMTEYEQAIMRADVALFEGRITQADYDAFRAEIAA